VNRIFFAIVVVAFLAATWRQCTWDPPPEEPVTVEQSDGSEPEVGGVDTGPGSLREEIAELRGLIETHHPPPGPPVSPMEQLTSAMFESAEGAVMLAIELIGAMALFLGLMKVAEAGGLLTIIARTIRPIMVRLFPEVPPDHPAMGAMILNMAANALGLGNAATPFGIRAMQELDKLNTHRGTTTNAMALFLAINTSSVTLLPTGVIAIRQALDSTDPAGILPTTLFATICSTIAGITAAKLFQRFPPLPPTPPDDEPSEVDEASDQPEALP